MPSFPQANPPSSRYLPGRKSILNSRRFLQNQRGVTLLIVLIMVVVLGLTLGIAGSTWKTIVQRAREEQLLWVGAQYRQAIESYFETAQAGVPATYPNSLEDLLKDPRFPQTVRHIRKLYKDPMTGKDFEPVRAGGVVTGTAGVGEGTGGIIGVRSTSKEEPFKKDGFPEEYADFRNAQRYSDWAFIFRPSPAQLNQGGSQTPGTGQNPAPGGMPGQGGNPLGSGIPPQ